MPPWYGGTCLPQVRNAAQEGEGGASVRVPLPGQLLGRGLAPCLFLQRLTCSSQEGGSCCRSCAPFSTVALPCLEADVGNASSCLAPVLISGALRPPLIDGLLPALLLAGSFVTCEYLTGKKKRDCTNKFQLGPIFAILGLEQRLAWEEPSQVPPSARLASFSPGLPLILGA